MEDSVDKNKTKQKQKLGNWLHFSWEMHKGPPVTGTKTMSEIRMVTHFTYCNLFEITYSGHFNHSVQFHRFDLSVNPFDTVI